MPINLDLDDLEMITVEEELADAIEDHMNEVRLVHPLAARHRAEAIAAVVMRKLQQQGR